MNDCLITFRSVTPGQRAERLVQQAGLKCSLQRTPKWMEQQGCGYSLRLPFAQVQQALEILHSNQVPYRKIYLRRDGGKLEELYL